MFLSKYGVARHIYIAIPKAGSANHAVSGDWTPSAGDCKISKDGGAAANVTNLPTAIAMGNSTVWDFSLTATEMQAAQIMVTVADSATKAVDDTGFIIETYGHASAQNELDLDSAKVPATIAAGDLATDSLTAAALKTDAVTKIVDAIVVASLAGSINVGELGYTLASAAGFAANAAADAATTKTQTTAAAIAAAVWNALTSGLSTVGSIGKLLVDKLGSVSGQVASQTEVLAIQNNTNVRVDCPEVMERPDSGSVAYLLSLYIYDDAGNMESPDSTPTITAANQSGTDRSANLSSVTNVATGKYTATYTLSSGDSIEQIRFEWTIVEGSATRLHGRSAQVVDTTAVDFTNTDRSTLATIAADAATAATQATQSLKGTNPADPVENSLTGAVKIDWGNIDSPGATVNLPATSVGPDIYQAGIQFTVDAANSRDEYTVTWFKNGVRQSSGITSPTIQVVKRADGTDLIASTAMSQIGSTGSYKKDATTTERQTAGEACLVIVSATIDAGTRTYSRVLGRDSTA